MTECAVLRVAQIPCTQEVRYPAVFPWLTVATDSPEHLNISDLIKLFKVTAVNIAYVESGFSQSIGKYYKV